jgi:hypothetical protein
MTEHTYDMIYLSTNKGFGGKSQSNEEEECKRKRLLQCIV